MTSPPSHEEFPESSGILLMWEMLLNGLLFFKWTSKKRRGIFLVVSLIAFWFSPCIFLLLLFSLSRGFLARNPLLPVAVGDETCPPNTVPTMLIFKKILDHAQMFPRPPLYFQYFSGTFSSYSWLYRKWLLLPLLSFSPSNSSAQKFSASSTHSYIPPSIIPTPGMPSFSLLSARDSCHLGPIRSDWSSILQHQVHLICEALQLGL